MFGGVLLAVAIWWPAIGRAAAGFDTSSPVAYFTSVADKFLKAEPDLAANGLSVTNIPLYPTNLYTPAVHRLLQLAANLYDASTNKTADAPLDFDYPSVFRPIFSLATNDGVVCVSISGFVEVATNQDYNLPVFSLPADLSAVTNADPLNINIYSAPWIIGAKKGLPNFNQVSMQSFSDISRRVQIVKPSLSADRTTWHTNIQYIVGISNEIGVQAWNSYLDTYSRPTMIGCIDTVTMYLTNELGVLVTLTTNLGPVGGISVSNWAGYPADQANPTLVSASFQIPVFATPPVLPDAVYHPDGVFSYVAGYAGGIPFDNTTGYPLPQFGLNITNRLCFVMVDSASGRVIDYVQLDGMQAQRQLTAELMATVTNQFYGGNGGVWDTNRIGGTGNIDDPMLGVQYQIQASLQNPPFYCPDQTFRNPITASDWANMLYPPPSFSTVSAAVQKFSDFYNKNTNANNQLTSQVPYTPTRSVSAFYTWQANDPLVHYTLADLTGFGDLAIKGATNYLFTNLVQANIQRANYRYLPWGSYPNLYGGNPLYNTDALLKDQNVTRSDDWNFPAGQLSYHSIGQVHRGTPWQTVYLKSSPVDAAKWQNWTGDTDAADATLMQPTNDWKLVGLLPTLLDSQDPRQLASVNGASWSNLAGGLTVVTNTDPPLYLTMDAASPQAAAIAAGIIRAQSNQPGGLFGNIGQILAAPELTVGSPWVDTNNLQVLTDSDLELIPSQLLGLIRPDSIGSAVSGENGLQWQFTGLDGYWYTIETSADLLHWSALTNLSPTNGIMIFSDPSGTDPHGRYYRSSLSTGP